MVRIQKGEKLCRLKFKSKSNKRVDQNFKGDKWSIVGKREKSVWSIYDRQKHVTGVTEEMRDVMKFYRDAIEFISGKDKCVKASEDTRVWCKAVHGNLIVLYVYKINENQRLPVLERK